MADFSLQALHDEIEIDPEGIGYAPFVATGSTGVLATLLNEVRAGININRGPIEAYEVINSTRPDDWLVLSAAQKLLYQTLTGAGVVDAGDPNVVDAFTGMFAGTPTISALAAIKARNGSRVEQLFGSGVGVTHTDVAHALEMS